MRNCLTAVRIPVSLSCLVRGIGEHGGAKYGEKAGDEDGEAAYRALRRAPLHGARRADGVRGGADAETLGNDKVQ